MSRKTKALFTGIYTHLGIEMDSEPKTCAFCRFANEDDWDVSAEVVHCRRHAPVLADTTQQFPKATWPTVGWDDWCGDWEAGPMTE